MTDYIAWTIFADRECSRVLSIAQRAGREANEYLGMFRRVKGSEPREGDIILCCRIDRIGSENPAEAA